MAKQQHCMEVRTLKRDVVSCAIEGDRLRVVFKSPNGSSKFALMICMDQALSIGDFLFNSLQDSAVDTNES